MTRIPLTDDSGRWFDDETAVKFSEDTWHDGRNYISTATGSQWEHESLYFTKSKRWILNSWSQYQHVPETHEEIDQESAVVWLIRNKHFDVSTLPESVRVAVESGIASAEL